VSGEELAMYHISQQTKQKIEEEVGEFILVSLSVFEVRGKNRTRYTVKKPQGQKMIHLVEYEEGVIRKI
jgi:hypothetical protein